MSTLDYYEVLNISTDADEQQIKKSYRKLALKYHPDKNPSPDAAEIFKNISEAYEILSDPEKRRVYDNRGSDILHDNDGYEYNPFAGFEFHRPEDVFADFINHMNGFGGGGFNEPMFPSFMMPPMHSPLMAFGGNSGFNHPFMGLHSMMHNNAFAPPEFMAPHFNPMLGQGFRQQSQSSSSYSTTPTGNNYSKSVTTSTRSVNGVVETIKITKITDENGTKVIEEYGNGITKINGIEQSSANNNEPMEIENNNNNNNNVRTRSEIITVNDNEKSQITSDFNQENVGFINNNINNNRSRDMEFDVMKQRMLEQIKFKYEQERLRKEQWEQQRRHEMYMQQQQQMLFHQQMMQQQQQMYNGGGHPYYNNYHQDDDNLDFQNIYYSSSSTTAGPSTSASYYHNSNPHLY